MSTIISRTKAKRLTLVCQAATVVCVLGGVALGVFGLPESASTAQINDVAQSPASPIPGVRTADSDAGSNTSRNTQIRIDPGSIAARLAMLDNAPKITQVPDTTEYTEPIDIANDDSGSLAKRVRYTGYISDSDRPLAFIRIDGTQRIVAQGSVAQAGSMGLDDLTITTVRPKFIMVSDGTIEDRILLAEKSGPSITMSSGAQVITAPKRMTEADVVLTAEELATLDGLSPRQRGARERMLRRQKLGRPITPHPKEPLASYKAGFGGANRPGQSGGNQRQEQAPND